MMTFAVLMWIGMGNDFIDSPSLATVWKFIILHVSHSYCRALLLNFSSIIWLTFALMDIIGILVL